MISPSFTTSAPKGPPFPSRTLSMESSMTLRMNHLSASGVCPIDQLYRKIRTWHDHAEPKSEIPHSDLRPLGGSHLSVFYQCLRDGVSLRMPFAVGRRGRHV